MIVVEIDVAMAKANARRRAGGLANLSAQEVAEKIGITPANFSRLKNDRLVSFRRQTIDLLCGVLECQPGDFLRYMPDEDPV